MQLSIYINQERMIEWDLNLTQASLVGILTQAPTWAKHTTIDSKLFFWVSKTAVMTELPAIYRTKDAVYRALKLLEERGLIEYVKQGDKDMVCLTEEIKKWNIKQQDANSEEKPNLGKKTEVRGKNRKSSVKKPNDLGKKTDISDNHLSDAKYQGTNLPPNPQGGNGGESEMPLPPEQKKTTKPPKSTNYSEGFERFWQAYTSAPEGMTARNQGKAKAFAYWRRDGLEAIADALTEKVLDFWARDDQWRRGYQPYAQKWLNERRYEDEPQPPMIKREDAPSRPGGATGHAAIDRQEAERKAYIDALVARHEQKNRTIDGGAR